jgi:hypothetical protein
MVIAENYASDDEDDVDDDGCSGGTASTSSVPDVVVADATPSIRARVTIDNPIGLPNDWQAHELSLVSVLRESLDDLDTKDKDHEPDVVVKKAVAMATAISNKGRKMVEDDKQPLCMSAGPQREAGVFGKVNRLRPVTGTEEKRCQKPLLPDDDGAVVKELADYFHSKVKFRQRDHKTPTWLNLLGNQWFATYDCSTSNWPQARVSRAIVTAINEVLRNTVEEEKIFTNMSNHFVKQTAANWGNGKALKMGIVDRLAMKLTGRRSHKQRGPEN